MKRALLVSFIAAASIASMSVAQAVPIHKWIDSAGNMHYSNLPPVLGPKSVVLEYKGLGNTSGMTKKEPAKAETPIDPEIVRRIMEEKEMTRQNCIRSKEGVLMLESGARVSRINAAGVRETLDVQMRAEELEKAKKAVTDWCTE